MRRRDFLPLLLGGATAWPFAARGQGNERFRRIGALMPFRETDPVMQASVKAFTGALAKLGWVDGRNLRIDFRFGAGDPMRFKSYAAELVALSPEAILASSTAATEALAQQTQNIPIVFVLVVDRVGQGIVPNIAHPGGNITGFSFYDAEVMSKWLQFLKEAAPLVRHATILFNPDTAPFATLFTRAIEVAAPSFGMTVTLAPVHDDGAIEAAAKAEAREPGGSLIDLPESFSVTHRDAIIAAASHHRLPLIGATEIFPRAGGLISYWFDTVDVHAEAASYVDRILKGAKPADLPVQQPTKFELVINLKTATALGLTLPQSLLARADEVIE